MDDMKWNENFVEFPNVPKLDVLPDDVLSDLSSDQSYLYLAALLFVWKN